MINFVKTTRYITLSAGTNNAMMTSVTTMQIFIEINEQCIKGHMISRILHS